jgi:hypothetical protein
MVGLLTFSLQRSWLYSGISSRVDEMVIRHWEKEDKDDLSEDFWNWKT